MREAAPVKAQPCACHAYNFSSECQARALVLLLLPGNCVKDTDTPLQA